MRLDGIDKITRKQYEKIKSIYDNRESIYYGRDVFHIKSITFNFSCLGLSCTLELVSDNGEVLKNVVLTQGYDDEIDNLKNVVACLDRYKTVESNKACFYIEKAIEYLEECC